MHVGDIVAIDVDIIPGLDEWANREDAEDVFVRGKYGTVLIAKGERIKVRVDGFGVDHEGWWFCEEQLTLIMPNPDYQEVE